MTPLSDVYDAFLARVVADDWMVEEEYAIVERDWRQLLDMAIFQFKYPRVSLAYDVDDDDPEENCFFKTITQKEIQVLATIMKYEWIKRCVSDWENIRTLYTDSDFSAANHLDKLLKLQESCKREVAEAIRIYDRADGGKPSKIFSRLAGKKR